MKSKLLRFPIVFVINKSNKTETLLKKRRILCLLNKCLYCELCTLAVKAFVNNDQNAMLISGKHSTLFFPNRMQNQPYGHACVRNYYKKLRILITTERRLNASNKRDE